MFKSSRYLVAAAAAAAVLVALHFPSLGASQPITFPTSMSVGDKDSFFRVQPWYIHSTDDPSDNNRELKEVNVRLMWVYGLTENTAMFTTVPVIRREWTDRGSTWRDSGLGDAEIFLRRTVYEKNWLRRTLSLSPFVGIELPTGSDSATGFPRARTLGSGSIDYFVGFAVRDATFGKPHRFLSMRYKVNTKADGFERGDALELNAAIKPPLATFEHKGDVSGINGMIEANLRWQDRHEHDGADIADSGGTTLDLTAGLVYTTHRWILEGAVRVPVVQDLRGDALKNDYKILIGVWRNW